MVFIGGAAALLDPRAKAEYRQRLKDLREALYEAQRFNDMGRAALAQSEIAFLTQELARAVGLGGRDRRAGSLVERARINVSRAVGSALKRVAEA